MPLGCLANSWFGAPHITGPWPQVVCAPRVESDDCDHIAVWGTPLTRIAGGEIQGLPVAAAMLARRWPTSSTRPMYRRHWLPEMRGRAVLLSCPPLPPGYPRANHCRIECRHLERLNCHQLAALVRQPIGAAQAVPLAAARPSNRVCFVDGPPYGSRLTRKAGASGRRAGRPDRRPEIMHAEHAEQASIVGPQRGRR